MTSALAKKVDTAAAAQEAAADQPSIFDLVKRMDTRLSAVLPQALDAQRFIGLALTELRTVKHLADCTRESVLAGLMKAAQRGLEIDSTRGQAYLIPRRRKIGGDLWVWEATFQVGYRGWIDLFGRHGIHVDAQKVHEHDKFHYQLGLNPDLVHVPARGQRGAVTDYYAVVRFPDGHVSFDVMSVAEVEEHRDKFASTRDKQGRVAGAWVTHFDAMALKTVILRAVKFMPLPVELRDTIELDEAPMRVAPDESALPVTIDIDAAEISAATNDVQEGKGDDDAPGKRDGTTDTAESAAADNDAGSGADGAGSQDAGLDVSEPDPAMREAAAADAASTLPGVDAPTRRNHQ